MRDDSGVLGTLAVQFAVLSLFAVGGGVAAFPEFQRLTVETYGWMSNREFTDLFALAQLSPGPNVLIVTLIGYQVAGIPGAAVTTAAICGPSCVLAYLVGLVWERFREARWRIIIQAGLIPLSIGLLSASAFIIARTAGHSVVAFALMFVAAVTSYWTRLNPLWIFGLAAVLGAAGLV